LANQALEVDERLAILRCLQALDEHTQANAVRHLLKDPNADVARAAQQLLARWEIATGPQSLCSAAAGSVLDQILVGMAEGGGDDLIRAPGRQLFMKKMGRVARLAQNAFSAEQVRALLLPQLSPTQLQELEALRDVDFSYQIPSAGYRFRVNVFQQAEGLAAVFRLVRGGLLELPKLGLPPVVA